MNDKTVKTLEFDKVLNIVSSYAVLYGGKEAVLSCEPTNDRQEILNRLNKTEEAYKLLYDYGIKGVEYFDEPGEEVVKAGKGASLNCTELLRVGRLLQSSRIIKTSFLSVNDESITILPQIAEGLYFDKYLEEEIFKKIYSEDKLADDASDKLFLLRKKIKKLNEQIRETLNHFIRSGEKYLQDNIVTMRGDRYVIPVKSEFKSKIKGFVHDQSSTGSTIFIEPIEVLELNNQLKLTISDEQIEVENILRELSQKVGLIADQLLRNKELIIELDIYSAFANFAYKTKSIRPIINDNGLIDIVGGRHPLIDKHKVVPLNVKLGGEYKYLLVTGPNTGGKTVSLKLVGLFTLMMMTGLFVPAIKGTTLSIFDNVYCDVGDEQSIEQSLSTFSSHIKNLVEITENAKSGVLILIDEIGAGTDPDDGSALAQAIIDKLIGWGSEGIITTHYSRLKEYAYVKDGIINACMEFDTQTFAPLYRLTIGAPGSSNALEIADRLGLNKDILSNAKSLLSDNKLSFDSVLREAENTRKLAEKEREEMSVNLLKSREELILIEREKQRLEDEKNRLYLEAKAESRRIIADKTEEAEELLDEIKEILSKEEIGTGDLIKARTIKNRLEDKRYDMSSEDITPISMIEPDKSNVKKGVKVYIKTTQGYGEVLSYNDRKNECVISVGGMQLNVKLKDFLICPEQKDVKPQQTVTISKKLSNNLYKNEVNVIGMRREEALDAVEKFIGDSIMYNVSEIRIVHGKGQKILSSSIWAMLKKDKRIKLFRFGKYGEGEDGVTIVTLN